MKSGFLSSVLVFAFSASLASTKFVAKTTAHASPSDEDRSVPYAAESLGQGGTNLVLTGGNIVNVNKRIIETRDLYICGGVIVDEKKGLACSPTRIDVSGKWLIPGLGDMHVHARGHLGGDDSWENASPREIARINISSGVTSILDAMQDEKIIFPARDKQRQTATPEEADLFCAGGAFTPTDGHGFEYLTMGVKKTALRVVDTPSQAAGQVAQIATKRPDVVKIMYDHRGRLPNGEIGNIGDGEWGILGRAMRKDVMEEIVRSSLERGLTPYVHIGTWDDARDSIQAGARVMNHMGENVISDELVSLAKENHVYWIPTAALYRELTNIMNDQSLLQDPLLRKVAKPSLISSYLIQNLSRGEERDAYLAYQNRHRSVDPINILKLAHGGVKLVTGTDNPELGTFAGWTVHREMQVLVNYGLAPWDALAAATINAGELVGHNYGIEPDAEGNVLVLSASPIESIQNTTKIERVIHHGTLVNTR